MTRLVFAPDLVEEAVLLAERTIMPDASTFRRERNRIYQMADEGERENSFHALHFRYFADLGLYAAVKQALDEHVDVTSRVDMCHVARALTRQDESADLVDELHCREGAVGAPVLLVQLLPTTVVKPAHVVQMLLHHELMHVADILNPAFGYERHLPRSGDGPSGDTMLQDRYRVLWDTTIDGRLVRRGQASAGAREARWRAFAATFGMLGDRCPGAFERWFNEARPTHAEILAFAKPASGAVDQPDPGRCPLCRFPTASLDSRITSLSDGVIETIRSDRPEWRREHGICPQCLDLYEARHREDQLAAAHEARG